MASTLALLRRLVTEKVEFVLVGGVAAIAHGSASVFGERLASLVCGLMGQYRLSKRNTQRLLADVLGVDELQVGGSNCP